MVPLVQSNLTAEDKDEFMEYYREEQKLARAKNSKASTSSYEAVTSLGAEKNKQD